MGASLKQPGFGGGIISPQALGRTDQQKYAVGLRECTNAWITRIGTIENRPGSLYCAETASPTARVRTVPFIFSNTVSYLLEFGHHYIRPLKNGARISVTGADAFDIATTYAIGDLVTSAGAVYYSRVASNLGNTPASFPADWAVQDGDLLEIPTDIPQSSLATLQYVQQNDIMTLTSQAFTPAQLLRYSDTRWAYQPFVQSAGIDAPTNIAAVAGNPVSAGLGTPTGVTAIGGDSTGVGINTADQYQIAAYDDSPERIGVASAFVRAQNVVPNFTRATGALPVVVSWSSVSSARGYAIYRKDRSSSEFGLMGITNGTNFTDDNSIVFAAVISTPPTVSATGTTFTYVVTAIDATSGAESLASAEATCLGQTPTSGHPNVISWDPVDNASQYRIYSVVAGVPGFIGQQPASPFNDTNFLPDTSIQPPTQLSLFATSDDYPAVCGYFQQRLLFANTVNQPQTCWGSRIGNHTNFNVSTPIVDSDAIQFTIAGRQVQPINALVDLGKLVVHTSNAEYIGTADQSGAMTPATAGVIATGSAGAELLSPVVIGNTDLFVQNGATRLNDLRYEVQSFSYAGKDLTKLSTDLFAGRTIVDLAWQKLPHSIVWCVLDNGQMVGLTYIREDDVWAWHLHDSTNGAVENVCVVPEGTQQVVYLVVRRTINGSTVRYHERLAPRECLDTVFFSDSVFVDAALIYDGRNTGSTTITASASAWTPTDVVTLTASVPTFALDDIGNQVVFQEIDDVTDLVDDLVSFQIIGYTSTTVVQALPLRTVPTWAQATAITDWGLAVDEFTGIDHLEGEDLAILADGNVAANPLDTKYPVVTVSGGAFTLSSPALVVTAGLVMQTDVESLPVETATGETIANKHVAVRECTPIFHNSRGGSYGQDADHLKAWVQPKTSPAGYPNDAATGPYRVPIQGSPQRTGQVHIRNTDPVPWGISALVVTGEIGN